MQQLSGPAHAQNVLRVLRELGSDPTHGLSEQKAQQRLQRYGPNRLEGRSVVPIGLSFLQQFNNPLLITLLVMGAVKASLGHPRDALVIVSVTVINAVIGTVQENKAESAIAALATRVRTDVDVICSGKQQRLPSEQLVPGDLVRLEAGAKVPADLRLISTRNLHTDESVLTGESVPVAKGTTAVETTAPLAEQRIGLAYADTFVTGGQALGVVVATTRQRSWR